MGVNIPKLFRKISRPIILANLDVDLFNLSAKGIYIYMFGVRQPGDLQL